MRNPMFGDANAIGTEAVKNLWAKWGKGRLYCVLRQRWCRQAMRKTGHTRRLNRRLPMVIGARFCGYENSNRFVCGGGRKFITKHPEAEQFCPLLITSDGTSKYGIVKVVETLQARGDD